jgi:hypothetical protein
MNNREMTKAVNTIDISEGLPLMDNYHHTPDILTGDIEVIFFTRLIM